METVSASVVNAVEALLSDELVVVSVVVVELLLLPLLPQPSSKRAKPTKSIAKITLFIFIQTPFLS